MNTTSYVNEFFEVSRKTEEQYALSELLSARAYLVTIFIFLSSYLVVKKTIRRQYSIVPRWPPGPRQWPLIGNILSVRATKEKRVVDRFQDLAKEYGDLVHINIGMGIDIVFISGADLIHEAYVKKGHVFSHRPQHISSIRINKELGIVYQNGEPWRKIKNFTMRALKDLGVGKRVMEMVIQGEAQHIVNSFLAQEGKPLEPRPTLNSGVANVIYQLLFNKRFDYDDVSIKKVMKSIEKLFANSGSKNYIRCFLPEFIMKYFNSSLNTYDESVIHMKKFVNDIIEEHIDDFDENNLRDLTDYYLKTKNNESNEKFSDETMFQLMMEIFAAGSETTSTILNWMIVYMIRNPHVQIKCREDIHKVIGTHRSPTNQDREQLPYIEAVIQETLRMGNIVPFSVSHCTSEPVEIGGYLLPEKTMILTNVTDSLNSEKYWDEADVFKPERWLTDDQMKIKKDIPKSFIPFGLGPRSCPGEQLARLEIFIFICTFLQRLQFEPETEGIFPSIRGIHNTTIVPEPYKTTITLIEE